MAHTHGSTHNKLQPLPCARKPIVSSLLVRCYGVIKNALCKPLNAPQFLQQAIGMKMQRDAQVSHKSHTVFV